MLLLNTQLKYSRAKNVSRYSACDSLRGWVQNISKRLFAYLSASGTIRTVKERCSDIKETKEINWNSTATLRKAYQDYCGSSNRTLSDVYGRYSTAKDNAYNYCVDLMEKFEGNDLRIISYNTFMFSAGFIFEVLDSETNEVRRAFCYITSSYDRFMLID